MAKRKPLRAELIKQQLKEEATHELVDLDVQKVDLVGSPATGDTFLVMRSEDDSGEPVEPDVEVAESEEEEEVHRQVPAANASSEEKRMAQRARAREYGIEALENKGENLSYPAGSPTVLSLYGDPVNLKYPLGRTDNKIDLGRANNARARFKQQYQTYGRAQSRRVVHTRIVKAQLSAGASPSYNPDDPLDRLLPQDLKNRLQRSDKVIGRAEHLTGQPLDLAFHERVVQSVTDIVAEGLDLVKELKEMPTTTEGGIKELPEDTLETFNSLGIQVARSVISCVGDKFEPDQALWNSIKRAGAKMSTTRLRRFKEALTALGSILQELEGNEERKMDEKEKVKREEGPKEEEKKEETKEVKREEVEEKKVEVKEEVKVEEKKEVEREEEKPKDDLKGLMEQILRGQESLQKDVKTLSERVETVERNVGTPNGSPETGNTQDVERKKESLWGGRILPEAYQK